MNIKFPVNGFKFAINVICLILLMSGGSGGGDTRDWGDT